MYPLEQKICKLNRISWKRLSIFQFSLLIKMSIFITTWSDSHYLIQMYFAGSHWLKLIIILVKSKNWFRLKHGVVRQQATAWTNGDPIFITQYDVTRIQCIAVGIKISLLFLLGWWFVLLYVFLYTVFECGSICPVYEFPRYCFYIHPFVSGQHEDGYRNPWCLESICIDTCLRR